jgi:hypothetical protein
VREGIREVDEKSWAGGNPDGFIMSYMRVIPMPGKRRAQAGAYLPFGALTVS